MGGCRAGGKEASGRTYSESETGFGEARAALCPGSIDLSAKGSLRAACEIIGIQSFPARTPPSTHPPFDAQAQERSPSCACKGSQQVRTLSGGTPQDLHLYVCEIPVHFLNRLLTGSSSSSGSAEYQSRSSVYEQSLPTRTKQKANIAGTTVRCAPPRHLALLLASLRSIPPPPSASHSTLLLVQHIWRSLVPNPSYRTERGLLCNRIHCL